MKTFLTLGLIVCLNLSMTSCSSSQAFSTNKATSDKIASTLNNTSWSLKRLDIENRDFTPTPEQNELILSFADNNYASHNGCNAEGGGFTIEDNKIRFGIGMTTMRYCGDEMKHLIYSVPFFKTKTITIKGKQLQLLDENNKPIATYLKKESK